MSENLNKYEGPTLKLMNISLNFKREKPIIIKHIDSMSQGVNFNNFIVVPEGELGYTISELLTTNSIKNKTVTIIPYTNPALKKPTILLYERGKEVKLDPVINPSGEKIVLKASTPKEKYIKKLRELKREIQLGNIYEINFCMEFFSENVTIDPISFFCKLNELAKAPYSYLVKLEDEYIICASPELFLKKEGNILSTKPIKGTAPRGKTKEEDEKLKEELFHNIKERTENVMAVDVARNDLSILAERGSVEVNKLYNIETYETVHQMVSTVKCTMANVKWQTADGRWQMADGVQNSKLETRNIERIIETTFPMASMTGAPKKSAMDLIDKFEDFERNYYSGAMGLIDEKGDFELCVIIRSIFYNEKTKRLSIAVGSAITHLCDPEKEYEECLLKAGTMLRALGASFNHGDTESTEISKRKSI